MNKNNKKCFLISASLLWCLVLVLFQPLVLAGTGFEQTNDMATSINAVGKDESTNAAFAQLRTMFTSKRDVGRSYLQNALDGKLQASNDPNSFAMRLRDYLIGIYTFSELIKIDKAKMGMLKLFLALYDTADYFLNRQVGISTVLPDYEKALVSDVDAIIKLSFNDICKAIYFVWDATQTEVENKNVSQDEIAGLYEEYYSVFKVYLMQRLTADDVKKMRIFFESSAYKKLTDKTGGLVSILINALQDNQDKKTNTSSSESYFSVIGMVHLYDRLKCFVTAC